MDSLKIRILQDLKLRLADRLEDILKDVQNIISLIWDSFN